MTATLGAPTRVEMPTIIPLTKELKSNKRKKPITGIVLHSTAGASAISSIDWLRRVTTRSSYHYIIERDGTIFKCVATSKRAWHAGVSRGWDGPNCNDYTIGIAFANMNDGHERVTKAQEESCAWLIKELQNAISTIRYISTHRLVSPGRKNDPRGWWFTTFCRNHVRGLVLWGAFEKVGWNG